MSNLTYQHSSCFDNLIFHFITKQAWAIKMVRNENMLLVDFITFYVDLE
jgi:hypothetical protein